MPNSKRSSDIFMKALRLVNKMIAVQVNDRLQFPSRTMVDTAIMFARCGVLLLLYHYVYALNNGVINGTTFLYAAWSIFFYFAFSTMRLRDLARLMMEDVQSGNIELLLTRPVSYLFYRMWMQVGAGLFPFVVITIPASLVLYASIGLPATFSGVLFPLSVIVTLGFGIILSLLIYGAVGLVSFWIEDINPIFWVVDKAVMILGGSFLPIALFPPILKTLAVWSPFGASYFLTHTVYESWSGDWPMLVGIQIFWTIIMSVVVLVIFRLARNKVSVNGG